jgi:signal transduction histidine kinase/Flp pilus assembly protein TadD
MDETASLEAELNQTLDPERRLELIFKLSSIYWRTDQLKMLEVLREAIDLARITDNKPILVQAILRTGSCYRALLKEELALQYFNEALSLAIEFDMKSIQARALNSLGVLYQNTSKFSQAIDYFEQARALAHETGEAETEALSVTNIGVCLHNLGQYSEALQYYLEATKIFEKNLGAPYGAIIKMIGGLALEVGDTESAIKHLVHALRLMEPQQNYRELAPLYTDIGTAYSTRKEFDLALKNYQQALDFTEMAGDSYQTVILFCMMSNLFFETGDFKSGWESLEKARQLLVASYVGMLEGMLFHFEGVGYRAQKEFLKAENALDKSLIISRKIGNTKLICASLCLMGLTLEDQRQYERACEALKECVQIAEAQNYQGEEYYKAYEALCRVYEGMGDLHTTVKHYKKFHELTKEQARLQSEFTTSAMLVEFEIEKTRQQSEVYRLENIELAEVNAQLLALSEERKEFISIAAHDLKNPLYSIKMLLNFLKTRETVSQEDLRDVLGDIETATVGMLHLIQNLLDAEIIENGRLQLNFATFPPVDIIKHVVQRYKSAALSKKINVRLDLDQDVIVLADTQYFMQAFDNILSNAIKYSPFEKNIDIRLYDDKEKETVRLEIRDEGPGISTTDMEKLFGKFQRLSARPTGNENSTGLGLAIVKKLVEAMNGDIRCESEFGNGSTFIIELPIGTV